MVPQNSMSMIKQFLVISWSLVTMPKLLQVIPYTTIRSNEWWSVSVATINKENFPSGTRKPRSKADLRTLASVAELSQPDEMKVKFRSKSHASIIFWLRVPFLFPYGACLSWEMVIGIWVPSIAPRQFWKSEVCMLAIYKERCVYG